MEFENDFVMRQIRDMVRMLAKVLFGKSTTTYEYHEEGRFTEADDLYANLIRMADSGKINEAENLLSDELEKDADGNYEVAIGFYDYLNTLSDSFLEKHNFSREEVKEGVQTLADKKGLGVLGTDLGGF